MFAQIRDEVLVLIIRFSQLRGKESDGSTGDLSVEFYERFLDGLREVIWIGVRTRRGWRKSRGPDVGLDDGEDRVLLGVRRVDQGAQFRCNSWDEDL